MANQQILLGAAGKASIPYIDDFFHQNTYKGTGGSHTITNNIDLAKGGLVWTKANNQGWSSGLTDNKVGLNKVRCTNESVGDYTKTDEITSFTSTGYTLGASAGGHVNNSSGNYNAYSFRTSPGFLILLPTLEMGKTVE